MAYSIQLCGDRFDFNGWGAELQETVTPWLSVMGYQFADSAGYFEGDLEPEMWFHPRGGLRGVTVKIHENCVELSLPLGVAEVDFLLAGALIRSALKHGATVIDEEERTLTGSDEEMKNLSLEYRQFNWSFLWQEIEKGSFTMPVGGRLYLSVNLAERVGERWDVLEEAQLKKMARYQDSYIASLHDASSDGVEIIVSNYHHQATLLSSEANYISLRGESGDITEGKPIAAERFYEILADRVENLEHFIYVPQIDFSAEPELVAKLKEVAGVLNAETASLPTGEDWMLLAKTVVLCAFMVAGADGKVDKKEIMAIAGLIDSEQSNPHATFSKILSMAKLSINEVLEQMQNSELHPLIHFAQVKNVLRKFPENDMYQIQRGLLSIAQSVAESSGGGLFGFGSKVSKKEQAVIDFLKTALA